jgi:hypothetical protein
MQYVPYTPALAFAMGATQAIRAYSFLLEKQYFYT